MYDDLSDLRSLTLVQIICKERAQHFNCLAIVGYLKSISTVFTKGFSSEIYVTKPIIYVEL